MPPSRRTLRRRERPDFESPRCGGRERPPYGTGEIRRPPGKMQSPRYTVGADSISARFTAAQGSAGGINPAPTGKFFVSGKPGGRNVCPGLQGRATALPQGAAAGQAGPIWNRPLHGVFAAAGMFPVLNRQRCGGRERPPYGPGETRRPPGKMQPPWPLQTHVGDDARTAPAGAFRRPTGPQVRLLGRRSSRGVRGSAGVRGRGMPLPYMASGHDRPNGLAAATRANVGRDALIPPHPAAAQGSAGGINPAPTGIFFVSGKPGGRNVCPGL